jgi:hypothetical protein
MNNFKIYRKTIVFSWLRLLVDILATIIMIGCAIIGFMVTGEKAAGLGIGLLIGIIIFIIMVRYLNYILKAGQIAMMTRGVTEGKIPDNIVSAGKAEVKKRFVSVSVYFAITSAIKGIFGELTNALNVAETAIGGTAGTVGNTISAIVQTVVSYLSDCCLGWIFYRQNQGAFKSTCEGAVLFFKNWKAFLKNLGRVFGIGIVSFIAICGAFTYVFYMILGNFPKFIEMCQKALADVPNMKDIDDPTVALLFVSLLFAVLVWEVLHNVFVRPFVLVGVLRNYMQAGIENPPKDENFAELDKISKKFNKYHQKSDAEQQVSA